MACRHWQPGSAFPAHVAARRERGEAGGAAFRMSLPLAIRRPLGGRRTACYPFDAGAMHGCQGRAMLTWRLCP